MQVLIGLILFMMGFASALEGRVVLTHSAIGDYVTAIGYGMIKDIPSTVLRTEKNLTGCECRLKCLVDSHCKGASYNMNSFDCVHTNASVVRHKGNLTEEREGSLFTYRPDYLISFNSSVLKMSDGLVYILSEGNVTRANAVNECKSSPGFRLVEFTHDTQQETLIDMKKILGSFHIGIIEDRYGEPTFMSGLPYYGSFMSALFNLKLGTGTCYKVQGELLVRELCKIRTYFACQAIFEEDSSFNGNGNFPY